MKNKRKVPIFIVSILLALLVGFIYLRFSRLKLIRCLKEVEKEREQVMAQGELTPDKIISIERSMDLKRDECYKLYK